MFVCSWLGCWWWWWWPAEPMDFYGFIANSGCEALTYTRNATDVCWSKSAFESKVHIGQWTRMNAHFDESKKANKTPFRSGMIILNDERLLNISKSFRIWSLCIILKSMQSDFSFKTVSMCEISLTIPMTLTEVLSRALSVRLHSFPLSSTAKFKLINIWIFFESLFTMTLFL